MHGGIGFQQRGSAGRRVFRNLCSLPCTTSLYPENPMIMVDMTPPGIPRYGNTFFLIAVYGYSRPGLSGRDIIAQWGYSVRNRPQASFLQGNGGRYIRSWPGAFAKHQSIIPFRYCVSFMNTHHRNRVLKRRGRRVKVVPVKSIF